MKAKYLKDTVTPNFLYHVKKIVGDKATICWTTRRWNYNETSVPLSDIKLTFWSKVWYYFWYWGFNEKNRVTGEIRQSSTQLKIIITLSYIFFIVSFILLIFSKG